MEPHYQEIVSHYDEIINLNNRGVDAMREDLPTSITLFQTALKAATKGQAITSVPEIDHIHNMIQCESQSSATDSADVVECAFLQAMYLYLSPSNLAKDPTITAAMVVAVVEFNVAVALHRHGLKEEGRSSLEKLYMAQSLYCAAQEILSRMGISQAKSSGLVIFDILRLCITNNLAQIAYFLSEFEESKTYFQQLAAFAGTVAPNSYNPESAAILSSYMMCILGHMHFLHPPMCAAVA
jgi:hypothetical protein